MLLHLAETTKINGNYRSGGLLLRKAAKQAQPGQSPYPRSPARASDSVGELVVRTGAAGRQPRPSSSTSRRAISQALSPLLLSLPSPPASDPNPTRPSPTLPV